MGTSSVEPLRARGRRLPQPGFVVSVAAVLLTTALSVLLRAHVPITLLNLSIVDDILYQREAERILAGDWLGAYDRLTLSKGPAYPLFVAAMSSIGLPLKIGEQLTWLAASTIVAVAVWAVLRRRWLAVAVYIALALNPMLFSATGTSVLRDNWYGSLALLFVGSVFVLVFGSLNGTHLAGRIAVGVVAGLSGAAYWLCREEGVWIVPGLGVIVVGLGFVRWRHRRSGSTSTRSWPVRAAGGLVPMVIAVIGFITPIYVVVSVNEREYGLALTNDLTSGAFARAYADWSRVDSGPLREKFPINRDQRNAVYAISPTARQLRPYLETDQNVWRVLACGTRPATTCDLPGALISWALRDAATLAGQFTDGPATQAFFTRLSQEIGDACDDGRLTCRPRLPAVLQPLQQVAVRPLAASMTGWMGRVLMSEHFFDLPDTATLLTADQRGELAKLIGGMPRDPKTAAGDLTQFRASDWGYQSIDAVYRVLLPFSAGVSLAACLVSLVASRRPGVDLAVLVAALLAAVLSRLLVMGLIDTTQFTIGFQYHQATYDLMLAFGVVGSAVAIDLAQRRRRLGRLHPGQAHGEAQHGELESSDDEDHADDGQPHRRCRVELPETDIAPLGESYDEAGDPGQDGQQPDSQSPLKGEPLEETDQAGARGQ